MNLIGNGVLKNEKWKMEYSTIKIKYEYSTFNEIASFHHWDLVKIYKSVTTKLSDFKENNLKLAVKNKNPAALRGSSITLDTNSHQYQHNLLLIH